MSETKNFDMQKYKDDAFTEMVAIDQKIHTLKIALFGEDETLRLNENLREDYLSDPLNGFLGSVKNYFATICTDAEFISKFFNYYDTSLTEDEVGLEEKEPPCVEMINDLQENVNCINRHLHNTLSALDGGHDKTTDKKEVKPGIIGRLDDLFVEITNIEWHLNVLLDMIPLPPEKHDGDTETKEVKSLSTRKSSR